MSISVCARHLALVGVFCVLISLVVPASAHHSYAMFDGSRTLAVSGTIAKLEWMNPHVFVWVYVRNEKTRGGHALYAFEKGSTNVLPRRGWRRETLKVGEKWMRPRKSSASKCPRRPACRRPRRNAHYRNRFTAT